MSKFKKPANILEFLEELRSIAQLGLNYTKDRFDRERYQRLLELTSEKYSELSQIPTEQITERFKAELGHITPKVGVNAAIFSENGHILLIKRTDDNLWCLPCGWAELNETSQESLKREVLEETGLEVEVRSIIDIFSRLPGSYGEPHTSYHILFHCIPVEGKITTSEESSEVGYYDHLSVSHWHRDHKARAQRAYEFWQTQIARKEHGR